MSLHSQETLCNLHFFDTWFVSVTLLSCVTHCKLLYMKSLDYCLVLVEYIPKLVCLINHLQTSQKILQMNS